MFEAFSWSVYFPFEIFFFGAVRIRVVQVIKVIRFLGIIMYLLGFQGYLLRIKKHSYR